MHHHKQQQYHPDEQGFAQAQVAHAFKHHHEQQEEQQKQPQNVLHSPDEQVALQLVREERELMDAHLAEQMQLKENSYMTPR